MSVRINEFIVADTDICDGKLTFSGTRIMVWQVLEMLRDGVLINDNLEVFPSLNKKNIKAALEFATKIVKNEDNYIK